MAHDQPVNVSCAHRAQVRRDDARARIARLGPARAGVVNERVPCGLYDGGCALPDVEHRKIELPLGRRFWQQHEQWQTPHSAQPPMGPAARREQNQATQHREPDAPPRWRVLHPQGRWQRREPLQARCEPSNELMRNTQQRVNREDQPDQRERNHQHSYQRNRHRVGEWPHE